MASNSARIRKAIRKRDGDRCHYCGSVMKFDDKNYGLSATVEHLKRKADGGSSRIRDLVLACRSCNEARGIIYSGLFNQLKRKYK